MQNYKYVSNILNTLHHSHITLYYTIIHNSPICVDCLSKNSFKIFQQAKLWFTNSNLLIIRINSNHIIRAILQNDGI